MKILLVNLPWLINGKIGVRAGSRWPHVKNNTERDYLPFPFFLAYSYEILKKEKFEVYICDAIASEMSEKIFFNKVKSIDPDILIAEISPPSRKNDLRILAQLNKKIKIVLCGPDHEVVNNKSFLEINKFITATLKGEYEQSLLKLMKYFRGDSEDIKSIGGLIGRINNKIINNSHIDIEFSDVNKIPWPHRKTLPMKKYIDAPGGLSLPCLQMWASRGCLYKCKFCAWPQLMFKPGYYRLRDPENILDEMEFLIKEMKAKSIYFDDDTFNIDKRKTHLFLDKLITRRAKGKIKIPWAIMARADLMDEELLIKFKKAGLYSVKYGVESASQDILNNSSKNMNLQKTLQMIEFTKKLGIKIHLTFIIGLPKDTKDLINKTIDLALSIDPDSLQFSIAAPFPGTTLYNELKKNNMLIKESDLSLDGDNNIFIKNEELTPNELLKLRDYAYHKWGQHLEKKRNPSLLYFSSWHFYRARQYFKLYGFKSLISKTADYIKFFIKHNFNIMKHIDKTFINHDLRLTQNNSSVKIFFKERELTNGTGLDCSFNYKGKRYSSSLCPVKFKKIQPHQGFYYYSFKEHGLDIDMLWSIFIMPDKIIWDVDLINKEKIKELQNLKFSLMLNSNYNIWFNSKQVEYLPEVEDWKNINIRYNGDNYLGITSDNKLYNTLKFDFLAGGFNLQEEIQNTSRMVNSRMLSAVRKRIELNDTREKIFSSSICIEN